jgi:predicted protein tyrosine phosphatase
MIHALFLCSRHRLRSPTAAQVFSSWPGVTTDSAGLAADADHVLELEQLAWADLIFVMEPAHQHRLTRDYSRHLRGKRVNCLGIPDDFQFMQPELVALLLARAGPTLRR